MTDKVEYLRYVIWYNKISKAPIKFQAIQEITRLDDVEELKRFVVLITYNLRFVPDFSTMTFPLRRLIKEAKP